VVEEDKSGGNLQGTSTDSEPTAMVEEPMDLDESTESLAEGETLELPQKVNYGTGCTPSCHKLQCENHLYLCASTTFSGNGLVIWAKFKTFPSHIINKHSALADPLFNR